jgi:hypothetical protein
MRAPNEREKISMSISKRRLATRGSRRPRRASPAAVTLVARAAREPSYDVGSYDPEMNGYVPPEVSLSSLKKGGKIGEGSFGAVFQATMTDDDGGSREVVGLARFGTVHHFMCACLGRLVSPHPLQSKHQLMIGSLT